MSKFVKSLRRLYRAERIDQALLTAKLNAEEITNAEYNWIIADDGQELGA